MELSIYCSNQEQQFQILEQLLMIFGSQNTGLDQLLFPLLGDVYNWGKTYIQRMTRPGMYEVLDYETTTSEDVFDDFAEKYSNYISGDKEIYFN